jgi:archaellum biogenesis ATPase FlaH
MSRENSRWTYTNGSRPEGVVIYDDDTKCHSHHDSDPARGQHNAFDLVRLHKYGHLDKDVPAGTAITDRPSYRAMVEFAHSLPEIRARRAEVEFEDLGELCASDAETPGGSTESGAVNDRPDTARRFEVIAASDFSSGAPLEWIVRSLLPRAELAVIFGESGSGKSFLTLDVCAAITRGIAWRAKRVSRGGVVYVCAEGSRGFKKRLRAYANEHKVELAELPAVIADAPNLREPKDARAITDSIVAWAKKQGQVDVVVIDTLSATTPGGNENSGEDVGLVIDHCKYISRQTGALVILIHHSGKDSSRGARGWSGLRAAADAEIEIVRNGDYRVANVTKLKDGSDGESFSFKLKVVELGRDEEGEMESSCVIEHVDKQPEEKTNGRQRAAGRHQITMFDLLKTMAPSGTVAYEDLVAGYVEKMPLGVSKRDNRRRDANRALEELIAKRLAFMHDNDRVSLTSLVTAGADGWLG